MPAPTLVLIDGSLDFSEQQVIQVNDLKELMRFNQVLAAHLEQHGYGRPSSRYISSIEAREIARSKGYRLPTTTLVNAYARGAIRNARKIKGSNRWESPEADFLRWLDRWIAHT